MDERTSGDAEPATRGRPTAGVFRHVLVAFDGSLDARRAALLATALAGELGGVVDVLLVVAPPPHVETDEDLERAKSAERENLSAGLSEATRGSAGTGAMSVHVVFDHHPARVIAEHVRMHGIDLVVMGDHGREQGTHGGIGRVLEQVLALRPCPVLVV
ncbi:MAG: universal stress protein [Actinomycetota bacterium]|jgi:nucleotide-binding universal stress UspA family protein|nr:universal stress protein [Actinomycetota bacterium]